VPLRFTDIDETSNSADRDLIGISDKEIVELVAAYRLYGFWRMDLESGHFFATKDIFTLFGMEYTKGPMNLVEANSKIHTEDYTLVVQALETCIEQKNSFHVIFRLKGSDQNYKFARCVGRYRETPEGRGEMVGVTYEFFERLRAIGFVDDGTENMATA
jgi:hypothetical protein